MEQEQWREVPEYPGYWCSDQGRVLAVERYYRRGNGLCFAGRREIAIKPVRAGYRSVHLYLDGHGWHLFLHDVVARTFLGPRPAGAIEIRHLDGDPTNNTVGNLAYGSISENRFDTVRHGRHPQARKTHCPRNHALREPNLRINRAGRTCLACSRARAYVTYSEKIGRPHQGMQAESDRRYHDITAAMALK